MYELTKAGLNGMAIAKVMGIQHQAVYQHLKELRAAGHLPKQNGKRR